MKESGEKHTKVMEGRGWGRVSLGQGGGLVAIFFSSRKLSFTARVGGYIRRGIRTVILRYPGWSSTCFVQCPFKHLVMCMRGQARGFSSYSVVGY